MQSSLETTRAYTQVGQVNESAPGEGAGGEAWAALLAHTVSHRFFTLSGPGQPAPARGDGGLTQKSAVVDGGEAPLGSTRGAADSEAVPNHLSGGIDAGELGRMRFSITRGPAGLELVLSLETKEQMALAKLESEALLEALSRSGLKVRSLVIADATEAGTALALASGTGANPAPKPNPLMQPTKQAHATRAYRNRPGTDAHEGELDLLG